MSPQDFKVGQVVYVQWRTGRGDALHEHVPLAISVVGRRWVSLKHGVSYRFDPSDDDRPFPAPYFSLDGGEWQSPGRVWLSLPDLALWTAREAAWKTIQDAAYRYGAPPLNVPLDILQSVAAAVRK